MRLRAAIAVVAVALITAESADAAATRYASPGGTGPELTCPSGNACSILDAVEGPTAQDGDTVLLAAGTYTLGGATLDVTKQLTIRPAAPAGPRPVITASAGGFAVDVSATQAVLADLEIRGTNLGLHLGGGDYVRLVVSAPGTACYLDDANPGGPVAIRLNDSDCLSTGGGPAVAAFADESNDAVAANLTNVTAVSPELGFSQYGIYTQAGGNSAAIDLIGTNVIALGGTDDIRAVLNNLAVTSSIDLDRSNFDAASAAGGGLVTPAGTGPPDLNQTAPPVFADLPGRDLHQAQSSPTIDAGHPNALFLSANDIDGDPRVVGSAPDIGSDEFVPEQVIIPDTTPPETSLTKTPRKKVRTKKRRVTARFNFVSNEAGSTFTCTLDGVTVTCTGGTFVKRVRRGRHRFEVAATDAAGNTDATPVTHSWRVKRKR